jgi:outer membrane protein assembly factor BamA
VKLRKTHPAFWLAAVLFPALALETATAASFTASKLLSIKAAGSQRYSSDDIVAATGLQPGQTVSEDDFKRASEFLGRSGAFSDVAYSFQSSAGGIKLDLRVSDSDPFIPAHFDDFVWLPEQQLLEKLHASVPLFRGQLPMSGELVDQVYEAFQALVSELGLQGRADYLRAGPQDGPVEAFDFSVVGQTIHLRNVAFTGADAEGLPLLEVASRKFPLDYSRSALRQQAEKNLLPVYLARGYLKAKIDGPLPKIVQAGPEETVVDVTFAITPGPQYKLSGIHISGNKIFSADQLRNLIHLQIGRTADAVEAAQDADAIKKLYGTRGYMGARIHIVPMLDDSASTARFRFDFDEGAVYNMGDLDIRGLDSRTTGRLITAWRLEAGSPYDSGYLQQFLKAVDNLVPGDQWTVDAHETVEDKDRVVDITLRFDHRAP